MSAQLHSNCIILWKIKDDRNENLDPVMITTVAGCHFLQVFGCVFGPDCS